MLRDEKNASALRVTQHLQHHARFTSHLAPAITLIGRVERAQIQLLHYLADEVSEMVLQ